MNLKSLDKNIEIIGSIAITAAITLIMLAKFTTVSGITTAANTAISTFITAIGSVADWADLIVLALVAAILYKMYKDRK